MAPNFPKFTIFLPVKNGGNYLHLCIESILKQSYPNFELVILENKSTDGSHEWLQVLALQDFRVKVMASDESLTIEDNWKRILTAKKNEYMTMIGHDDLLDCDFLEVINNTIIAEPNASLYLTHFRLIDSCGELTRYCSPMPKYESAVDFLAARMGEIRDSFGTGYVMRSELYDKVGGIPSYPNLLFADDALWLKLIDSGVKVTSSQVCFSYRLHSGSTSGKPDSKSLFYGLKNYLNFLKEFFKENTAVISVIRLYGPQYVAKRCQEYYCKSLRNVSWGKSVDEKELLEINSILSEFAAEYILDDKCLAYGRLPRAKYWVYSLTKEVLS